VDDYTRRIFPFLVANLSEFFEVFKNHVARMEAELGREKVVAQLLADNHKVHVSQQLQIFCTQKGIQQLFSPPYTPSLNPAERYVGIIIEMARVMLIQAGAPQSLAGEAIMYAAYLIERTPSNFEDEFATPLERWTGRKQPDGMKEARVWGCAAWMKDLPAEEVGKFDPRAKQMY